MLKFLLGLVISTSVCFSTADEANWAAIGSAGNFSKSRTVQMLRETVNVALDDAGMHVKASFWFKNHGRAQTIQMGFPDHMSHANLDPASHEKVGGMKWFKSSVDGTPIKVTRTLVDSDAGEYTSAWVKTVTFSAGQIRRVDVAYFASHGFTGDGYISDSYILKTGATWKGPILSGKVAIDWSNLRRYSKPELICGPGAHIAYPDATHAVLTFSNLKPRYDVSMMLVESYFNFTMNGKPMTNGRGLPDKNGGALLTGPHDDILIPLANVANFLGLRLSGNGPGRQYPEVASFGQRIEFAGANRIKLGTGETRTLPRPFTTIGGAQFVHLKDLIKALGGSYRYVKRWDRVDITLPVRRGP